MENIISDLECIRYYNKYSKRYNKFLFPAFAGAIYVGSCKNQKQEFIMLFAMSEGALTYEERIKYEQRR